MNIDGGVMPGGCIKPIVIGGTTIGDIPPIYTEPKPIEGFGQK